MVVINAKLVFISMLHILLLSYSYLIVNHAIALYTVMLTRLLPCLLRRTLVLAFLLCGTLTYLLLLEEEAALEDVIFFIYVASLYLLYLTSSVDRRSHQYSWVKERQSSWLYSNSSCMDERILSLISTRISCTENYLLQTFKLAASKLSPFIEGGGRCFTRSCISWIS